MSAVAPVPDKGLRRRLSVVSALLLTCLAMPAQALDCPQVSEQQLFDSEPQTGEAEPDWLSLYLECLPPLKHPLNGRFPLILWRSVGFGPHPVEQIQALLARGVVPHLPMSANAIPAALALQSAGAPVILMEGKGATWPYSLLGEDKSWMLETKDPERLPRLWRVQPDPTRLDAWALGAEQIRNTLHAFKKAGVKLDAVWLDYEGQPLMLDYQTIMAASEVKKRLPAAALVDAAAFARYRRQFWAQLMSAYVAGPIREVYPQASVTNWIITLSSQGVPVLSWDNWSHPDLSASLFTATNPIAYGIDTAFWSLWPKGQVPKRDAVDRLYMHVLLRQVSADAWNRSYRAPYMQTVPWVARWVREQSRETPMMSRTAYREALRHLWLRGVDGMQVFNPYRAGRLAQTLSEASDVQAVYDEMLAYPQLLETGEVMNYEVPAPAEVTTLWSGLRDENQALVRVVRLGEGPKLLHLEAWPGERVLLPAMDRGASFLLSRNEGQVRVKVL